MRPANWDQRKAAILVRDRGRCVQCGDPASDVEPLRPEASFPPGQRDTLAWSPANLAALCPTHRAERVAQARTVRRAARAARGSAPVPRDGEPGLLLTDQLNGPGAGHRRDDWKHPWHRRPRRS